MTFLQVLVIVLGLSGNDPPVPLAEATRGITGTVTIEIEGGALRGRPDLDLESPLLVRIADVRHRADGRIEYDLQFIGTDPGVFDLRDVLVFADGSSTSRMPAIPIEIISNLDADAPSDLAMTVPPPMRIKGGYVTWLIVIGAAWIAVPFIVILSRLFRPKAVVVIPPRKPTLADQLAPLVEAAANRELSVPEQARLELLLYWHWQDHLELDEDRPEAVARLRRHEVAGRLLQAVESWLHDPRATAPSRGELTVLLQPYSHVPTGGAS